MGYMLMSLNGQDPSAPSIADNILQRATQNDIVNQLCKMFSMNGGKGILRKHPQHALVVAMKGSFIRQGILTTNISDVFSTAAFTDEAKKGTCTIFDGNHRRTALIETLNPLLQEYNNLIVLRKVGEHAVVDPHLDARLADVRGQLHENGLWLVKVYDQGRSLSYHPHFSHSPHSTIAR